MDFSASPYGAIGLNPASYHETIPELQAGSTVTSKKGARAHALSGATFLCPGMTASMTDRLRGIGDIVALLEQWESREKSHEII